MQYLEISQDDIALIEAAKNIIEKHFKEDWHHIGVACRGKSGKVYTSVNMDTYVGGMAVCGEPIAIAQAVLEDDLPFETIVAVRKPRKSMADQTVRVVSPCGKCREMIADYASTAWVVLEEGGQYFKLNAKDLLPHKFVSNKSKKGRHDEHIDTC